MKIPAERTSDIQEQSKTKALFMNYDLNKLAEKAKQVLENNRTEHFTKPTQNLYPHQWSWDAGFIAVGYSHYKLNYAIEDLKYLFSAQWDNGMIPHIVFDDKSYEDKYFPGPSFWQTEKSHHAPKQVKTSGICQPPVHATAVRKLIENSADKDKALLFAKKVFNHLKEWHHYLYRERDENGDGLVYIRHPWESGQDNSPLWDPILQQMNINENELPAYERKDLSHIDAAERPDKSDYDRYVFLVDLFRKCNYDEKKIREEGCPFLVEDVLFNTILCRANKDMAFIAEAIGEDPNTWMELYKKTKTAIDQKLWCEEKSFYVNFNVVEQKQVHERVLAGFLPLYAGVPDKNRANTLFNYLNTHCFCRLDDICLAAPTYDRSSSNFSGSKYWRGPIWINLNWMLCLGLSDYGYDEYASRIMETIIKLPAMNGFYEYFDPDTGKGYGSNHFSWTAALFLDALYVKGKI